MTMNEHPAAEHARRLRYHVHELAIAFGIVLREVEIVGFGVAASRLGHVTVGPVTDEVSYAIALHELGHCLHPLGHVHRLEGTLDFRTTGQVSSLRDVRLRLVAERAAWEWARQYATEWTEVMAFVERESLATYIKDARRYGVKE